MFFKTMYNKTIIRFGFSDILNNRVLGMCHHPWPSAWLITLTSTLIIPDITKTSSNNNLLFIIMLIIPIVVVIIIIIVSCNFQSICNIT